MKAPGFWGSSPKIPSGQPSSHGNRLKGHVLEGKGWAVEEFHDPQVVHLAALSIDANVKNLDAIDTREIFYKRNIDDTGRQDHR